jgi:hypothetical protein
MWRRLGRLVLVATVLVTAACSVDERVLATVGDETVPLSAFQEHLAAVTGEPWQGVTDAVASRMLDQFLDEEVVAAAARRDRVIDLPADPGRRSTRVRTLLEDLCGAPPEPDEAAVDAAIAAASSADRPARAHVRQMLLASRDEADDARRQLLDGADFVALSKQVSLAPNADGGGELGFLTQGGLPEDLDEVIFALGEGEISDPVPGPSGYHIFQVLEVVPSGPPPRAEVEPEVRRRLREGAAREHAADCVDRLARQVGVRVLPDRLWFRYQGRYTEEIHAS